MFWIKLAAFLLPALAYLAATMGIGFIGGEFTNIRKVAEMQAQGKALIYGRAYRDNYFAYKLISSQVRKPELLILGSSRTMQFRSQLADLRPGAFYNAGGAVQSIFEVLPFLHALEETGSLPKALILGLDQPWFNASAPSLNIRRRVREQMDEEKSTPLNRALNVSKLIFMDMAAGKVSPVRILDRLDPVTGQPALGIAAIMRGSGFRNDGSYQYPILKNPPPVDERLAEGYQRIKDNISHFAAGAEANGSSLREMESVLAYCKKHGIFVAGFSPPFAPGAYAAMQAGGKHAYLAKSADSLSRVFLISGFPYRDFGNAAWVEGEDEDMVDAFHGSEFVYLRIYQELLALAPAYLGPFSNAQALASAASMPRSHRLIVFEDPEPPKQR